MLDEEVGTI